MRRKTNVKSWVVVWVVLAAGLSGRVWAYSGGTGEPNNPYRIATPNDLNDIGNHPEDFNKCFVLVNGIDLSAYTGTQFNIIGRFAWNDPNNEAFTGVFDGNGHTITNFSYTTSDAEGIGLFAYVAGDAGIENLGLIEPNVDAGSYGGCVGALVGWLEDGTVTGCWVQGGSVSRDGDVGGLVGICGGHIINSYTTCSVTGHYVGGVVGQNFDGGLICNCYATGPVSGFYAGGLVGINTDVIINSYAVGSISGTYIGGLVGYNEGIVANSYAAGSVSGTHVVGGLAALNCGRFTCSYWDTEATGQSASAGGEGKTTAEMKNKDTFSHWTTQPAVWTIDDSNDYPHLACEQKEGEPINTPCLSDFLAGSGTRSDPFLVHTAGEFNRVGSYPCEADKHYVLMDNIDLSQFADEPCNTIALLSGAFDGQGHTISGFSHTTAYGLAGVFGYVYGPNSAIRNLGLIDPNVRGGAYGYYAGTLAGRLVEGTVSSCWAESSKVSGDGYVGGLVGENDGGTISNSYATGAVVGRLYVGGLVGSNDGVTSACHTDGSVIGDKKSGGLAGKNYGDINYSYTNASVGGGDYVGGLVGANYFGVVSENLATGNVSGVGEFVGGLVGFNRGGVLANSYATGAVGGDDSVGGLVGRNENGIYSEGEIHNCYSTGNVSGNSRVGGLVGDSIYAIVSMSFWDIETSDCNTSDGGNGLTTTEMQTASTFTDAGWDFVDTWDICEGTNYPRLVWQILLADFLCPDGADFVDYAFLAGRWGDENCGISNDCDGADLDFSGAVHWADLRIFCDHWLEGY